MANGNRSSSRLDTALFFLCVLVALAAHGLPDRIKEPIAQGMRRTVVAPLLSLQRDAELWRTAYLVHDQRALVGDSIAARAMRVDALQAENVRLRLLLGLGSELKWGFIPAEALHNRGQGEEYTLTLTAGSNAGVRPFSPVVAPEGLVGMVRTVDPTMSIAIMWSHPDFRVSAMAVDGSAFGIVGAHLAGGPERWLLEMSGIPFRTQLRPGTEIVSSGLGGVYPRGIPIGTVLSELQTPTGWARTYLVRPAVMPADVNSVMILTPPRAAAGIGNVWVRGVATDSATRAIAAAGDSVARQAALAEAAARARARDSARADSAAQASRAVASAPAAPAASSGTSAGAAPPAASTAPRPRPRPRRVDTTSAGGSAAAGATGTARADTAVVRPPVFRAPVRVPPARPESARADTARHDTTRRTPPPAANPFLIPPPESTRRARPRRDTTPRTPAGDTTGTVARRDTTPVERP